MKKNEVKKPFYKLWWFWVIVALSALLAVQTFTKNTQTNTNIKKEATTASKKETTSSHVTTKSEKGATTKKSSPKRKSAKTESGQTNSQSIEFESEPLNVISKKKYDLNFSDKNWDASTIKVNHIEIIKTTPFTMDDSAKETMQGLAVVNISILPSRDIYAYTSSANLITNDGQQVETEFYSLDNYKDNPSGAIANGVNKEGNLIFPLEKLEKIEDLSKLRLKFDAVDDNNDDDTHDYDLTINLA